MEQEKNKKGVVVLLAVLVVILAVLCVLFAIGAINLKSVEMVDNNANENTATPAKTVSDVVGQYTAEFTDLKTEDENFNKASITLNLYDNGVFTYTFSQYAPYGTFGNYYVNGETIVLTTWFNTDSGTGLNIAKGSKTLTINSDGTISDNSIKAKGLTDNEITSAILKKNDNDISSFEPSDRLSVAFFNESNHTVSEPAM